MTAGTVQVTGRNILAQKSDYPAVTQVGNYWVLNNGVPTWYADRASPASIIEQMFAQTRTRYVVPRYQPKTPGIDIVLHRVVVWGFDSNIGILITSKDANHTRATYSIAPRFPQGDPKTDVTCVVGSTAIDGAFSLQGNVDGFYGLKNGEAFLSAETLSSAKAGSLIYVSEMQDSRQRWIIRPVGGGLFSIINRSNGDLLTDIGDGCATLTKAGDVASQEWAVKLAEN
jgi:hypothetical protein